MGTQIFKLIPSLIVCMILLCSCITELKEGQLLNIAADTSSVVIEVWDVFDEKGTIKSVTITKPEEIEKIQSFITDKEAEYFKCGYNGRIKFLSDKQSIIWGGEFNTECGHIVQNGAYTLSKEGLKYLEQLQRKILY